MKYFTSTHEWCDVNTHQVGLSSFAKNELGEIVYLQMPKLYQKVACGEELCILESTKSAADLYAPYEGIVTQINPEAITHINQDPEGAGWLVVITPTDPINVEHFLNHRAYMSLLEQGD